MSDKTRYDDDSFSTTIKDGEDEEQQDDEQFHMAFQSDWRLVNIISLTIPFLIWKIAETSHPVEKNNTNAICTIEEGEEYERKKNAALDNQYESSVAISLILIIIAILCSFRLRYFSRTAVAGILYGAVITITITIVRHYPRLSPYSLIFILGLFLLLLILLPSLFPNVLADDSIKITPNTSKKRIKPT